jgi:hypothetical protein
MRTAFIHDHYPPIVGISCAIAMKSAAAFGTLAAKSWQMLWGRCAWPQGRHPTTRQRLLTDVRGLAVLFQNDGNQPPAATIGERAVYEDYILYAGFRQRRQSHT